MSDTHDEVTDPRAIVLPTATLEPPAGGVMVNTLPPLEPREDAIGDKERAQLDHVFKYHAPSPDQLPKYEALRSSAKAFAETIMRNVPPSADRTAALRKVREAVMTANSAIALSGRSF